MHTGCIYLKRYFSRLIKCLYYKTKKRNCHQQSFLNKMINCLKNCQCQTKFLKEKNMKP